jgi:hypothetical protein
MFQIVSDRFLSIVTLQTDFVFVLRNQERERGSMRIAHDF